jgi:hypothetical protein
MKTKMCLILGFLVFAISSHSLFAQSVAKMEKKLQSIIIENMVVEDASVKAVINLLRIEAKRSDPLKKGINIVTFLEDPKKKRARARKKKAKKEEEDFLLDEDGDEKKNIEDTKEEKTITLMLDDVSLQQAIKSICMVAELNYRVEEYAVVIAHKNHPMDAVKTKMYPVPPEVFLEIKRRMSK